MTTPVPHPPHHDDPLLKRSRRKTLWRHGAFMLGVLMLLAGYALLAVSPETPADWVLIRVASGFALLFIGFGTAILPILTRTLSDDE